MRCIFSIILLITALPVSAQMYQYTDANGRRVYTDQPPMGVSASNIELSTVNSVPATVRQPSSTALKVDSASKHSSFYSQLQIIGLPTEQTIRANDGSFTLQVEIIPKLANEHRLQLLIDGKPYGATSHSTTLSVENLDRGEHRLAVQVLANDQVIQRSAEHTIYLQRMHINHSKAADQ